MLIIQFDRLSESMKRSLLLIFLCLDAALSNAAGYQQLPGHFGGLGSDSISISADDFQLTQDTLIGSIAWWGAHVPSQAEPDRFSVTLFSDNGGQPGTVLPLFTVGRINSALTGSFVNAPDLYPEYRYSADLQQPFLVQANARYWLSIVNPARNTWVWEVSGSSLSPGSWRSFYGGPWGADEHNVAFELATVAEPQIHALVVMAMVTTLCLRSSKVTGANAGGRSQLPRRAHRAAHVAQFRC